MSEVRFLLDENVDPVFVTQLERREPTMIVWRVGLPEAPPEGTLDPDILIWCERHSFILVTNNRRSMPPHLRDHLAAGRHMPGIFILNANLSLGANMDNLWLVWSGGDPTPYRDLITYLPV